MMMGTIRKKELIEYMNSNYSAKLQIMADFFNVSVMTIRRDLLQLENQGFVTISRGVAYLNAGTTLELSSALKDSQMLKEKKRIAKRAVQFISEGSTVFFDNGTTVRELAYEIVQMKNLTVITNSLLVINILCNFPHIACLVVPGALDHKSMGFFDATTCTYMARMNIDIAFFGAEGVDTEAGFMVPSADDAEYKRVISVNSADVVVLADSSKIGKKSLVRYADFDTVNVFVTDNKCDQAVLDRIQKKKAEIIVA
ncbi:MAG: DeoR/GlpR family DNA-binding transcription regulator [Treponema sp.]|jgi:DeoR/GlpR family transcriptional regulator of sugar metabolism|nr:DeoR/GlpR family DNA-binding transcription regulator [Treponema sp.]